MVNALTNSSFFSMLEVLTIFAMREHRSSAPAPSDVRGAQSLRGRLLKLTLKSCACSQEGMSRHQQRQAVSGCQCRRQKGAAAEA